MRFIMHSNVGRMLLLLMAGASLSACVKLSEAKENILVARDKMKEQTIQTQERFKELIADGKEITKETFTFNPDARPKPRPVPTAFCYQVLQDIVCYNQPLKGAEYRLVGWQGTFERTLSSATHARADVQPVASHALASAGSGPKLYANPHPIYGAIKTPASGSKPVVVSRNPAQMQPLEPVLVGAPPEIKADKNQVVIHEAPDSRLF